jgi:hypothetical protein
MFAPGDEENMLQYMSDTWANLRDKDVFGQWSPLGPVTGLLDKSGIFDTAPLKTTVKNIFEHFGNVIQRKAVVSCVDANSGTYLPFTEQSDDFIDGIIASAAIPFVFPNIQFPQQDAVCMDGGSVWNTNLVSALERCREEVDDDSQITIDIVLCQGQKLDVWESKDKAEESYLRYKQIRSFYDGMDDVLEFKMAYPDVNFRHLVFPSVGLPDGLNLLNFDNKTNTWGMQMQGRVDGANAQKSGEGFYFDKMEEWVNDPALRSEFPKVGHYLSFINDQEVEKFKNE